MKITKLLICYSLIYFIGIFASCSSPSGGNNKDQDFYTNFRPGLYLGDPLLGGIFKDTSSRTGNNVIEKSIDYIKSNINSEGYFLLLDKDGNIEFQHLNVSNFKLTLIGLGKERKISRLSQGSLFLVGYSLRTGIALTLGNNITLVGYNDNNASVVKVEAGASFTMLEGSKVTGNITYNSNFQPYAIGLSQSSTFVMKGGIVTGNTGGVNVSINSFIYLEGGVITENTNSNYNYYLSNNNDVLISSDSSIFFLPGNTIIDEIFLNKVPDRNASVYITSGWNGKVKKINLHASYNNINDVKNAWKNNIILRAHEEYALTANDIAKFPLGVFFTNSPNVAPASIVNEFKIEDNGPDIGKLVALTP